MMRLFAIAGLAVLLAAGMLESVRAADATAAPAEARVVFSSTRGGTWAIWIVKPDGSDLRQLTKPPAEAQDVDPVFSPDGQSILFTSTREAPGTPGNPGGPGLWRMARDGGSPTRVCAGDQGEWSPDGRKIVFRRTGRLLTRDLAGGQEKAITPEGWDKCSSPAWSPDGARVAFARLGEQSNALYLVPADGGAPTKVYDQQGACEPHWSPDGQKLIYETETHLCSINPDGTKNRLLTYFGGLQRYARFSPDGKQVVFCQGAAPDGPWELYVLPAAGGTPARLIDAAAGTSDMYPDWR
jgi:Tol biopolymer transport system component